MSDLLLQIIQSKLILIQKLWAENKKHYLKAERGSQGNEGFVKEFLVQIFQLTENNNLKNQLGTFKNQLGTGENNHTADFVLYPSIGVIIPLEVERLENSKAGAKQLLNYQLDFDTRYGILTDGKVWRFFASTTRYTEFDLEMDIFPNLQGFLTFWQEYINTQTFYKNYFNGKFFDDLFGEIRPKVDENRERYFDRTTKLVGEFKAKLIQKGFTADKDVDKKATELAYSYLIQYILFKTLVDSGYFGKEYSDYINSAKKSLESQNYGQIIKITRQITDTVGNNIYKPFFKDQEDINQVLSKLLFALEDPKIEDVTLFLDIIIYIDSFNFEGLASDIFGYVYENYLKELYSDENRGQYFTDPLIAELMLDEMGWTLENLVEKLKNKEFDELSLIDPACGSGTFLYSATRILIKACQKAELEVKKTIDLVVENIVGFDIEEFSLYLAEMNILMRLLPLIYADISNLQPVEKRLKIFWTEDSLSEFTDIQNYNQELARDMDANPLFETIPSKYQKFMRDELDLKKLKEDLLDTRRQRFDFVIANPPYIGYNDSSKMGIKYFEQIKKKEVKLNNVFGVNLHSTTFRQKKYSPKPNLYAFFLALNNALLKNGGKFCFIIPQTLLTAGDLDVARYFLTNNFQIQKLITFQNNLFVNRGVKQNRKIATSSLIIMAKKDTTKTKKSNQTTIINYQNSESKGEKTSQDIKNKQNCEIKKIPQKKLLDKYENWNWIKHSKQDLDFYGKYVENSQSLEIYYNHKKAEKEFGNKFWFDGGTKLDTQNISKEIKEHSWKILDRKNTNFYQKYLNPKISGFYSKSNQLIFPQGSQGINSFETKYKIIWNKVFRARYHNFSFCNHSDLLFADNQIMLISSDSKTEILYLFSLLNSKLNLKIIDLTSKLNHEQLGTLASISAIKSFIRIPILDTEQKKTWKTKLIVLAQELLDCENIKLEDLVDFDFDGLLPARFEKREIEKNKLVLNDKYKFEISKNLVNLDLLKEILTRELICEFTLQEIRKIVIFDKTKQDKIKNQMDNLVNKLYEIENQDLEKN